MLRPLLFTIAERNATDFLVDLVQDLLQFKYLPKIQEPVLQHSLLVAQKGNFPSYDYYKSFYEDDGRRLKNRAEILVHVAQIKDFWTKEWLVAQTVAGKNNDHTTEQFVARLTDALSQVESVIVEEEELEPAFYSAQSQRPTTEGFKLGVPEIDQTTNGIQPGTVCGLCGFVANGKSTWLLSSIYKNIKDGRKGILFSLEVPTDFCWNMLQARFMYEEYGMDINTTDLMQNKLTADRKKQVIEAEPAFKKMIADNILIIDESYLSETKLLDYKMLSKQWRKWEEKLGCIDFTAWDHVHQLELMFHEKGNRIIKSITSTTKTFVNSKGNKPCTLFAVQTNRDGFKRASKRQGVYDNLAIADLNEVERSCSVICFIYAPDDLKIVQECKVMSTKNRFGPTVPEPVVATFAPAVVTVGTTVETITSDGEFDSMGTSGTGFDEDVF